MGLKALAMLACLGVLLVGCSTGSSPSAGSSGSAGSASPPSMSTPPPTPSLAPPPDPAAGSEPVRFDAAGGIRLAGRVFGSGQIGVVLAHQVDDDQSDWYPFAQRLASLGYRALTFDLRGYCPGSGDGCSSGSQDVSSSADDVDAAARFLRSEGVRTIFLIGASVGGQAVLVSAARSSDGIAGVVSMSAPENFAYDITAKTLAGLRVPTLFIAGRSDGDAAASARDFARWVGGPTELIVIDTSEHGVDLLAPASPAIARAVHRRIRRFLERSANR